MKLFLKFCMLLLALGISQITFGFSFENLDNKENPHVLNCQLSELQMTTIVCNDSFFIAEFTFLADNPNPFGYNILLNGVFYAFNQYDDTLTQSFVVELIDPDLGSEILVEVFDEGDITCGTEADFLIECEDPCSIGTLDILVLDCDTLTNTFAVELDFIYDNVESAQFEVHGNGTHYGTFQYTDLPITIGGFEGDTDFVYELIVYDFEDESCSSGYSFFGPVDCSDACDIDATEYEIVDCNPLDSTFYVNVWFEYANIDSLTVSIFGGGYDWGEFDAWEQPMTLGPYYGDQGVYEVIIQDTYDPECFDVLAVDSPSCLNTDCQLSALAVDIEYCSDSLVFFDASFLVENAVSPVYNIILNGAFYGFGMYSTGNNEQTFEFAIEDPQFGSIYTLELFDEDDVNCATAIEFVLEPCSNECALSALEVDVEYCTDSIVFFDASFLAEDPASPVYNKILNGDFIGFGLYSNSNNEQTFEFAIEDPQFGSIYTLELFDEDDVNCATAIEFVLEPCSNECALSALEVDVEYCTDSIVFLDASFLAENVNPSFVYNIYLNEEFYGYYQYSATNNEQIFDFVIEDPQFGSLYTLEIVDEDDVSCATAIEFVLEPCSNECALSALEVDVEYCTDSIVFLDASFLAENVNPSFVYNIYLNEEFYGYYQYSATNNEQIFDFVIEDPQFGSLYTLEIVDEDDVNCATAIEFVLEPCSNECTIDGVDYTVVDCNPSDSTYYVNVWFDYDNADPLTVSIYGSGYDWGEFDAWEQPIQLGPFYGAEGVPEQIIQNVNDPSCATEFGIDSPSCFYTDCYLDITEYNIVECNQTDSTFYVELYINHENLAGDAISIYGGGYDWGIFDPNTQPIIVGPYFSGQMDYEIIVADQLDSSCNSYVGFGPVDCSGTCDIEALEYEIVDCNPLDSTFYVNVWFEYDNLDSLTVSIFGGGYDWGEFDAWEQPVQLGPFYGDQGVYEVIIQDTYDSECFDVLAVDSPSCLNTACQLSALAVDIEYCTDSIVFFDASFLVENPVSPVYNIILNGEFYGFGLYSDSNDEQTFEFAIENPQFGSLVTVELFDEDDVNCATAIEFVLEPCSNECALNALEVDVEYCTDSLVFLDASFLAENAVSPVYNKILNGEFIGFGLYSNTNNEQTFEFAIEDPQFGSLYTLELFDEDDVDCATTIEFVLEPCSNDCSINALEYEIVECNPLDSTFYVNVWFEYDNLDSLTVSIFGGGYDWGEFDAWEQPVQLGPFYGDQGVYEVIIQDTYDSECFDVLAVDSPSCLYTDCYVDITDYIIECVGEDSIFYVELFIDVANLSSDSLSVFGGGYDWGEFSAGLESIVVGPYFAGEDVYEILISDSSNPDCVGFIEFEEPDCIDACDIDIVEYNIVECSETDSLFYLEVFFEYDNLLGDAISIFGGGYNWGIYNPALQPILIGPFFTGELEYEIIVADQLDLDCFDIVGFEFNGCDEECELIEEIWLENGPDCLGDLCEIEIGVDLSQAGAGLPVDIHLDGFSYFDYPVSQLAGESFTFVHDSLEFSSMVVCISGSFDCCDTLYFDVPPTVVGDVWPGDANSDNIANNIDLLYIGLANGFQGLGRPNQGIDWEAYESEDWDFFFPESGVNFKHADSNGDGLVDEDDIEAIEENYGLTHGAYDPDFEIGGPSDPPLYIDLPSYVQPDQLIEAEIVLGEFSNQVSDLYGIAFTVEFPDGIFQNNEIEFDSTGSWIGGIDADMYTFSRDANGVFEVDITLVRKDQSNAGTNYGRIGNFIGVIDDVLGLQEASVKIKNVVAISNDETVIPLNLPVDTMIISSTDQILDDGKIHVYPVPTNKFLYLETDIAEDVSSMEIITLEGIRVRHYDHFESRLDLKDMLNGVYLLRVRTDKGIYQERIMIFN